MKCELCGEEIDTEEALIWISWRVCKVCFKRQLSERRNNDTYWIQSQ